MARSILTNKLFEELYLPYPRKQGKSPAQRALRGQITSREDVEKFHLAVKNYKEHLKKNGTEPQFVMYFDTFCRQFRDWLEDGHGSVNLEKDTLDLSGAGFDV